MAWFPILFYTTLYIGDLYKRSSPIPSTEDGRTAFDAEATRLGSRALFWSSVVSMVGNIVLPAFVTEPAASSENEQKPHLRFGYGSKDTWWKGLLKHVGVPVWMRIHLASLWALSHVVFALCMFATL
jgi:solute carrier family 45 protein 1/2/4